MNRLECSALRCIAIICIIIHNYAHKLPGAAPENEFSFCSEHYEYFLHSVISKDFFIQFFSFFGHLGVPVFVLLTGYGLAQKYDQVKFLAWKTFLYKHWNKLFFPLISGTFVFLFVMYMLEGRLVCSLPRIIAQCSMLLNVISPMHLMPMPYWYLGLTMQLYIIYLLFVHNRSLRPILIITIIFLMIMFCFVNYNRLVVLSKFNFIGWLVPFCLGIAYSRNPSLFHFERGDKLLIVLILSFVMVLLCGFNYYSWLLIPFFVAIIAVGMVKYIPVRYQQKMNYIGNNSIYLLVIHPIIRDLMLPFVPVFGKYSCLFIYVSSTFIIMYIVLLCKRLLTDY